MSYATSEALQVAVYDALSTDGALADLLNGAIFDAAPEGPLPETYLALGTEDVRDRSNKTGLGADHRLTLQIVTTLAGFRGAKAIAGRVSDILVNADLSLARGRLVSLRFLRARAVRTRSGEGRRIDLTFRALVEDD